MSKEMPLKVFAAKYRWNPKEEEWILKNDKDTHYYNNSALKNAWSSLSYPIYDGDYYFAFIHDKPRVNAQYNAKANRELRKYITSTLDADEIFERMQKYFSMQFKDAGSGDTMTREELWTAIVDMRQKNPVKEELEEVSLGNNMLRKDFPNVWATRDGKLYRALATLINFDGFVDNMKAYKKNPKTYLDSLRKIANNPKQYAKYYGKNFPQYINNPKPGQAYAKLPESLEEQGMGDKIGKLFKTKDKKEIDGIANLMNMTSVKVLQSMMKQNPKGFKRMAKKMGELPAMEEVQESVEKTTEKLVERNMLGRLAKQLKLNEEGKQKMFTYFEKGELNQ